MRSVPFDCFYAVAVSISKILSSPFIYNKYSVVTRHTEGRSMFTAMPTVS